MRRLMTFFMGMVTGCLLLLGAQHYHLIRSDDGFHLVPKVEATLASTYVDIRNFTVADWAQHANIANALVRTGKDELMEDAANNALRNGLDRLLDRREQTAK